MAEEYIKQLEELLKLGLAPQELCDRTAEVLNAIPKEDLHNIGHVIFSSESFGRIVEETQVVYQENIRKARVEDLIDSFNRYMTLVRNEPENSQAEILTAVQNIITKEGTGDA